ncbi:AcvB/VirJ family lysyl-phosphatidylglycerol hydrolase [Sphingomonas sp. MMS24-JH45]
MAVVNISGDMGLRFLLGASTSSGLTEHHIPVVGITSPALFRTRRTRAAVDAIVADTVRTALARTGARRIVMMGQSYGADIVQTGLARLPADLRARVAGIVLILPGRDVYFRADPTGLAYRGARQRRDHDRRHAHLAPLTCIYGAEEDDSLCPRLHVPGARAS